METDRAAAGVVLHAPGAVLAMQYEDGGRQVHVVLSAERGHVAAQAAAELMGEALARARASRVSRVVTALDASAPACGAVMDVLRRHVGQDVARMTTHRAGASVMIDLELRPLEAGREAVGAAR